MKTIFLSFVLSLGLVVNSDRPAPFLGKWHNVSKTSAIEKVIFYPDNNVRLSNSTYSFNQWYSLSQEVIGSNTLYKGVFKSINVGKLVKESKVSLRLLNTDLMELMIDDKKFLLRKD